MKFWIGSAPSNIALIKYMGKIPEAGNRPTNSSFSYTLSNLRTFVMLSRTEAEQDSWQPLTAAEFATVTDTIVGAEGVETRSSDFQLQVPELSEKGRDKFLKHFAMLKKTFGVEQNFVVRSANNFASDCGLASSASSFAALTYTTYLMAQDLAEDHAFNKSAHTLAELSRQGSGSSCRSFFAPWSVWSVEGAQGLELPIARLAHSVVLAEVEKKLVSSSEAHARVATSLLFSGRPQRAELRMRDLIQALKSQDWASASQICWEEFWDMHALFETSRPAFGYMNAKTLQVLTMLKDELSRWDRQDWPLVTMDAGPNVHLLWKPGRELEQRAILDKLRNICPVVST